MKGLQHRNGRTTEAGLWHEADVQLRPLFGRYRVESGHHRLIVSISAFDPQRTSEHTGNLRTRARAPWCRAETFDEKIEKDAHLRQAMTRPRRRVNSSRKHRTR